MLNRTGITRTLYPLKTASFWIKFFNRFFLSGGKAGAHECIEIQEGVGRTHFQSGDRTTALRDGLSVVGYCPCGCLMHDNFEASWTMGSLALRPQDERESLTDRPR